MSKKMREVRLKWFGHVKGRRVNAPIIRRKRGWLKRVLGEAEVGRKNIGER